MLEAFFEWSCFYLFIYLLISLLLLHKYRYRLDVFANGRRIYFDRPSLKFQSFNGVTVYTPTYILNQSEVVIMFGSGAGVEVVESGGFLAARVYLPWEYIVSIICTLYAPTI